MLLTPNCLPTLPQLDPPLQGRGWSPEPVEQHVGRCASATRGALTAHRGVVEVVPVAISSTAPRGSVVPVRSHQRCGGNAVVSKSHPPSLLVRQKPARRIPLPFPVKASDDLPPLQAAGVMRHCDKLVGGRRGRSPAAALLLLLAAQTGGAAEGRDVQRVNLQASSEQ